MANSEVKTIDIKTAETLYRQVQLMELMLKDLEKKILKLLPAKYGSQLWWEKSTEKALEEIKRGKGVKFTSVKETIRWLNS